MEYIRISNGINHCVDVCLLDFFCSKSIPIPFSLSINAALTSALKLFLYKCVSSTEFERHMLKSTICDPPQWGQNVMRISWD